MWLYKHSQQQVAESAGGAVAETRRRPAQACESRPIQADWALWEHSEGEQRCYSKYEKSNACEYFVRDTE